MSEVDEDFDDELDLFEESDVDDEPDLGDDDADELDLTEEIGAAPAPPTLYYPSLDVFVSAWLAPTYRRHLDNRSRIWCPRWWYHDEAVARLDALWRAWEHLRREKTLGMSVWFKDHADVHMAVLMDPDGPFRGCRVGEGHAERLEPLPLDEPPEGLFTEGDPR